MFEDAVKVSHVLKLLLFVFTLLSAALLSVQVVTAFSGQWCFGVLLHLPVLCWCWAPARLQQLTTFWRPHTSQPNPRNCLHHHGGGKCFLHSPLYGFCVAPWSTHSRVLMPGLHRGWLHPEPPQSGSDRGEHPRKHPCTARHRFVPTPTQRQLDTTWHPEWWGETRIQNRKH